MIKISIVCVGKIKEKFFRDAIDEYSKRLSRYSKLNIIEVADEMTPDGASAVWEDQIREKEGVRILAKLPQDALIVTLEIAGRNYSSEEFAAWIEDCSVRGKSHICFVIGGSLGLHNSGPGTQLFQNDVPAPADACDPVRTDLSGVPDHSARALP